MAKTTLSTENVNENYKSLKNLRKAGVSAIWRIEFRPISIFVWVQTFPGLTSGGNISSAAFVSSLG